MEDKEVGELWAKAKLPVVRDLISKLVEERASYLKARCPFDYHDETRCSLEYHGQIARQQFGINPNDYEKPS